MSVIITPSKIGGNVKIPCSKSMAHRLIICAALATGTSKIYPACHSNDIDATLNAVVAMGAGVEERPDCFYITGIDRNNITDKNIIVDCGESGSTVRFLLPVAAALGINATFCGHGRLPDRPLNEITCVLKNNGVVCSSDRLPLTINGQLNPAQYNISGKISSQYLSGLLFAMPIIGNCKTTLSSQLQSKDYVLMTVNALKLFGLKTKIHNNCYSVSGSYCNTDALIEGDWSQCCFYLSAAAMGADLTVSGLDTESLQGDKAALDIFGRLGANHEIKNGMLHLFPTDITEKNITIDCKNIPDMVPSIAAAAAFKNGVTTTLTNAERLRFKESDRIKATVNALRAMQIVATETPDGMIINGANPVGGVIDGANDHRIVMAFSLAAAFAEHESQISTHTAVKKSYPQFFEDFENIGGKYNVINDGK